MLLRCVPPWHTQESPTGAHSPRSLTTGRRHPPTRSLTPRDRASAHRTAFVRRPRRRPGRKEHHVGGLHRRPVGVSSDHPLVDRQPLGDRRRGRFDPGHRRIRPTAAASDYILMSRSDLLSRPTSGAAWSALKARADSSIGSPDIQNQDESADQTTAKALVFARTGIASYRTSVVTALKAAVGTESGGRTSHSDGTCQATCSRPTSSTLARPTRHSTRAHSDRGCVRSSPRLSMARPLSAPTRVGRITGNPRGCRPCRRRRLSR